MLPITPLHQPRTGPANTCGTDCRRKHESPSAGSGSSFSGRTHEHRESTRQPIPQRNNASQSLLAATALHSAHALLVVVHSETSTYSSHSPSKSPTRGLHNADRVGSGVVRVSSAVRNSSIRNHLQGVSSRENDRRRLSPSSETSIRSF